jgi:D-alanine-D-alanine ligase-like ATP-grasp enzyme
LVTTSRSLASQLSTLTYPLVIKPDAGLAGVDVFVNLHHFSLVSKIAKSLLKKHTKIVIENFVSGVDHRFLVLDGQVIGVIQKHPPIITGDGSSSIQSLIANHPKTDLIPLDDSLRLTIAEQGLLLTDILSRGTSIAVRGNANLATGGSNQALPLTEVHPELLRLAVSAARAVHTRLAGVDILIKDPHSSSDKNAVVIEVNHNPGIWMHHYPDEGLSQPVATAILKSMFNL